MELGACVLRTVETKAGAADPEIMFRVITPFSDMPGAAHSGAELSARRKMLACAEIGLVPGQRAFASCITGLRDALSAKDMSNLYRNP